MLPCQAGGTIPVSTFVTLSSLAGNTVILAGIGSKIFGVSQKANRPLMPGVMLDGNAALAGEPLLVYQQGNYAGEIFEELPQWRRPQPPVYETGGPYVVAGAPFTPGVYLKADANGNAIHANLDGDQVGAISLAKASRAGQLIPIQVLCFQLTSNA